MSAVTRQAATAKALAEAFASSLRPGPNGVPIIEDWKGSTFTVRGSTSGERYRVSVKSLPKLKNGDRGG